MVKQNDMNNIRVFCQLIYCQKPIYITFPFSPKEIIHYSSLNLMIVLSLIFGTGIVLWATLVSLQELSLLILSVLFLKCDIGSLFCVDQCRICTFKFYFLVTLLELMGSKTVRYFAFLFIALTLKNFKLIWGRASLLSNRTNFFSH